MKNVILKTAGNIKKILNHCGDMGEYYEQAISLLAKGEFEAENEVNNWADIMYDRQGTVYAIWAEDELDCTNAQVAYVQLDEEDAPEAFAKMRIKMESEN